MKKTFWQRYTEFKSSDDFKKIVKERKRVNRLRSKFYFLVLIPSFPVGYFLDILFFGRTGFFIFLIIVPAMFFTWLYPEMIVSRQAELTKDNKPEE